MVTDENQILFDLRHAVSLLPPKEPEVVILTSERDYRKVKLTIEQHVKGSIVMRAQQSGSPFLCGIRVESHKDTESIAKRAIELKREGVSTVIFSDLETESKTICPEINEGRGRVKKCR